MAAAACARRTLLSSISPTKAIFRSSACPSTPTLGRVCKRTISRNLPRLPVELGASESLLPFHSVTASALLTSMLTLRPAKWGCLSEGCHGRMQLEVLRQHYSKAWDPEAKQKQ